MILNICWIMVYIIIKIFTLLDQKNKKYLTLFLNSVEPESLRMAGTIRVFGYISFLDINLVYSCTQKINNLVYVSVHLLCFCTHSTWSLYCCLNFLFWVKLVLVFKFKYMPIFSLNNKIILLGESEKVQ